MLNLAEGRAFDNLAGLAGEDERNQGDRGKERQTEVGRKASSAKDRAFRYFPV